MDDPNAVEDHQGLINIEEGDHEDEEEEGECGFCLFMKGGGQRQLH